MRIALCQIPTETGDVDRNLKSVIDCIDGSADMYMFPEMYLTNSWNGKSPTEKSALDRWSYAYPPMGRDSGSLVQDDVGTDIISVLAL